MPVIALTPTDAGRNLIRDAWKGTATLTIKYFALGTSNVMPTNANTKLINEVFRKSVTTFTNGTNPGEVLINCYVSPADAIGVDIEEVGVFAGTTANAKPNTGVLLGRGLWSHNAKTGLESVQVQLDLTTA